MSLNDTSNPWTKVDAPSSEAPPVEEEASDSQESDVEEVQHIGDYSTHMEELFEGDEGLSDKDGGDDDEFVYEQDENEDKEDEDGFVYDGVDADASVGYKAQLREVLGQDHEDSESEVLQVEKSLIYEDSEPSQYPDEPLPQHSDSVFLQHSPATSSRSLLSPDSTQSSPDSRTIDFKFARPFLHPTVSRLRSYTPQSSKAGSNRSSAASHSHIFGGMSPSPSHFSSMSRMSSISNLNSHSSEQHAGTSQARQEERQVFKWTDLQSITRTMYSKASQKASNLLGTPLIGLPTTVACNGLICIGTTEGKVAVHNFNQTLLCVCESNIPGVALGPVTAVALSHDHTFVAAGHASGYIQLYNLKQPNNPVRSVAPTTLAAVASGRKEGHLQGSKIGSIGFIAGRHTALVSADEHGLAFFHSLGKILFVEAPDILRILGRYPDPSDKLSKTSLGPSSLKRQRYTIIGMAPLPLGTAPHSTDNYNVVALLTPTKLVIVGLKPTPRTWFKCPRDVDEGISQNSTSKWIGSLAWFPSFLEAPHSTTNGRNGRHSDQSVDTPSVPMLAYSWGNSLHLIQVSESPIKQTVKNPKTGKQIEVEIGTINYQAVGKWTAEDDILTLQWLNHNQILVVCRSSLGVYDIKAGQLIEHVPFDGSSLISQNTLTNKSEDRDNEVVTHSIRTYKGRIFMLKHDKMVAGTLLTWADLILSLVQSGDFLKAIELTRSYYVDEAPGNRNGLPIDPVERKDIIGEKLRSLMDASSQYVFSEDRMADDTHSTPDNRGVDRTSLFEGLVKVCCKASIALDDFEYLFEDLFQRYDDSGIATIYLRQLEPFVLNSEIRYVPPRITQRLVALYEEDGRPEHVERIIWHMDASCLDLNQTIRICQQYHLYDALVYIYTRAMHDYVAPLVEFLGLIRKVQRFRKMKKEYLRRTGSTMDADTSMESTIVNAYKIYPYLANILSGLAYPSEEPLSEEDAFESKKAIYAFLFFGRSSVWPPGDGGKLILTSDEEGGVEPTYPYPRLLLSFDSESFLHSLDIAFEDAYLNDESQPINRFAVVKTILEIMSSGNLPQEDVTMINIFIARNVPKYPQFLFKLMAPSTLHKVLVGLSEDPDVKTREDRQLAAEYLLSVYNPHDSERIMTLFENAGFFRILRSWHYHERKWAKLLSTYIVDPDISSLDLLGQIEEVLLTASRSNRNAIPIELIAIVTDSLPRLLDADKSGTACLLDKLVPQLHSKALEMFANNGRIDQDQYEYLCSLVGLQDDGEDDGTSAIVPSKNLTNDLWDRFFDLRCLFDPEDVVVTLRRLPKETLELSRIIEICESRKVYDAVVWTTNWQGDPQGSLSKADKFQRLITRELLSSLQNNPDADADRELQSLQAIAHTSRQICMQHSQANSAAEVPLEDMWFELLSSEIRTVQSIASSYPTQVEEGDDSDLKYHPETVETMLASLRYLVQTTFSSLVSITSTSTISFPRLFKRLVNATPSTSGSQYTEFRMILTGMLESYRSDEDLLNILKHLINRDLFESISSVTRERACGWPASQGICRYCRKPMTATVDIALEPIIISRAGLVFHQRCKPPVTTRSSDI